MQAASHRRAGRPASALLLAAALCLIACDGRAGGPPAATAAARPVAPLETPAPRGPFPVGLRAQSWTAAQGEPLEAWIYYPAAQPGTAASSAGAPPPARVPQLARRYGADAAAALAAGRGHAALDAPAAERRSPVLVFAPGANMGASDYRALLEDVASRGYVVVALAPEGLGAGRADPDLSVDYARSARELGLLVDHVSGLAHDPASPLAGRIDPARIGVFGHSLGGASAVLAMSRDPRIAAAANLDGDFSDEAAKAAPSGPILYVMGSNLNEAARSEARRVRVWGEVSARSTGAVAVKFESFHHLNFLDAALLAPASMPADRRTGRFGEIDGARGLRAAADLIAGFFDERLQGRSGAFAAALQTVPEAVRPADYARPA